MVLDYCLETIFVKQGDKCKKGVKDTIAHNGKTSFSKLIKELSHVFVPLKTSGHTPEPPGDRSGNAGGTDSQASIPTTPPLCPTYHLLPFPPSSGMLAPPSPGSIHSTNNICKSFQF